jgi:hypothetical protein
MPAAAPTARAPQYSSNPSKPDNKRKYALLAGGGAAVVVVAVIVFLVLNSGSGGTGGTSNAQSPGNQPTTGHSSSKPSSSDDAPAAAKLGQTPTEGRVSNFSSAGKMVIDYFGDPAAHWNQLTPAAQQVYGSEQQYQEYWAENKGNIGSVNTAHADSGGNESDGSLIMNVNVAGGRHAYRLVIVGGQTLIDASTKLDGSTSG